MEFPTHIVAVCGLIRNDKNEVLLIKHPVRGWDIPGGQVETGEDLIEALERETFEETGIRIRVERLLSIYSNVKEGIQWDGISKVHTQVILGFSGLKLRGEPCTSEESLEVGWFPETVAADMVSQEPCHSRIKDMLGTTGSIIYRAYHKDPYTVKRDCKI